MKRFLALYVGSLSADEKANHRPTPDEEKAIASGMEAWGNWMAQHADAIADPGAPLGTTLRASRAGISQDHNRIVGYVIVEAETHEAAARMFEHHPHFVVMPGDSVEIMECLSMPEAPDTSGPAKS